MHAKSIKLDLASISNKSLTQMRLPSPCIIYDVPSKACLNSQSLVGNNAEYTVGSRSDSITPWWDEYKHGI